MKTSALSDNAPLSNKNLQYNALSDLQFTVNKLVAKGAVTDEGFVLKKGSQLSKTNTDSMPGKFASIKEKQISDGVLINADDCLVAAEDVLFNSSSYATAIVAVTSRSGRQSWKTVEGKTLKSIEDDALKE